MIKKITLIPENDSSKIFTSAQGKLDFEKMNYMEEEYFFEGTSNVYEEDGINKKIIHEDISYLNRMICRRPKNMKLFDGNVYFEILNATAGFDIDRIWMLTAKEIMRRGGVYIGITSKPDVLDSFLKFDANRYNALNWGISYERKGHDLRQQGDRIIFPKRVECETGLIWDMLTEVADLLRGENGVIPTRNKKYLYLTGWSQSVGYLYTYVHFFENVISRKYDGYFAAGGVHSWNIPLNQEGYGNPRDTSKLKYEFMPVPYISVQTESENGKFGITDCVMDDSDTDNLKYVRYDIAGSTHDAVSTMIDYYKINAGFRERDLAPTCLLSDEFFNHYPYEIPFSWALNKLTKWVRLEERPPSCPIIPLDENAENVKDKYGNAVGGLRTPLIDFPVCTYVNYGTLPNGNFMGMTKNFLFGHEEPFSPEKLTELYGDMKNYKTLVTESYNKKVTEGYLLIEDKEECIHLAINKAIKYGLK